MGSLARMIAEKVAEARREWGWFLTLGIVLTLLGVAAIYYDATATFVSVVVLGAFLLLGGLAQVITAFWARGAGHVILYLLLGAFELVAGFVLVREPGAGRSGCSFRVTDGSPSVAWRHWRSARCFGRSGRLRVCGSWASLWA